MKLASIDRGFPHVARIESWVNILLLFSHCILSYMILGLIWLSFSDWQVSDQLVVSLWYHFLVFLKFSHFVFADLLVKANLSNRNEENEKGEYVAAFNNHNEVQKIFLVCIIIIKAPNNSSNVNNEVAEIELDHHDVYWYYE